MQPEASDDRSAGPDHEPHIYDAADLMGRVARETEGLKFLLAQVEDGIINAMEDNRMKIEGDVATSLQQLDLAIQTAVCIVDVLTVAAEHRQGDGHNVGPALSRMGLRDMAERFAK